MNEPAIHAYATNDATKSAGLRRLGAVLNLHGIAMNGGLVGGAIENLFLTGNLAALEDAVAGLRWLGMEEAADTVARARREYARFRPNGDEDLTDDDVQLWEDLDRRFFEVAEDARLEQAITEHLAAITASP